LFGDKQCYILSDAADAWATTLTELAASAPFEHYLIVIGGDLPKSSKLRAWGEKQTGVASLPCYEEKPQNFLQRVVEQAKTQGLTVPRDAAQIVASNLDGNIAAITPTLQKLALYVHPHTTITTADAIACVANQTLHALDDLVAATFSRDRHILVQQFPRFWESGESAVAILRACQYYAARLLQVQQLISSGLSTQSAVDKLKPKLFYQHVDRFYAQLNLWPLPKLLSFIDKLQQAEFACKQTGAADTLVAERTLISG
jgi:DNA polymerase-3 subunit delta